MADAWDDDGSDAWDADSDVDDAAIEAKLGLLSTSGNGVVEDDEEDLAVKDREADEKAANQVLKTKGNALAAKRAAEEERKLELEVARQAMELDLEREKNMTPDERRALERQRVIDADAGVTNDLFGGVDAVKSAAVGQGKVMGAGDVVKLVDLKDHLKHAKKVGQCIKGHKKVHLAAAFLKEVIQESKDVLDDDAITELITTMNVIKNEKVAAAKKKVKGQAQKSAKRDKAAEAKAAKLHNELYGDHDKFHDKYDDYGDQYEDDFF